jgi:Carboxypeptidase regulatory-like domain/TonB-dependent Receptor Plug Domain
MHSNHLAPVSYPWEEEQVRRIRPFAGHFWKAAGPLSGWLLSFCLTFAATLHAQTFYASLSGVVTDQSGAVVPNATVTVVETDTSVQYKTVTNSKGSYQVSFLKPGQYVVKVQKSGFQDLMTKPIALVLNQAAVVDATLRVGGQSQQVTVSAEGTTLDETNAEIGNQIGSSDLVNLPENIGTHGAEELLLAAQVPGVSSTSPDYSNPNNISLGGGRPDTNPIIVDGLPSNMGVNDTYGLVPTPDSTEELQVLTSPFSAQYGQSGGGAILTTTKSGTRDLHGSLFEYHNDQSLNALSYFSPPNATNPKAVFNYFGGSVGGPVDIPHLINGRKHHLFFFTDWEDTLNASSRILYTNVPTDAERTGDFSGPTPQGQPNPPVYDPQTLYRKSDGTIGGTQFKNNMIPSGRLDSVGMKLLAFYPSSNCNYLTYNYCVIPPGHNSYLYNADRVDYNVSDYDHIWAKFSRDGPSGSAVDYIPNAANTSSESGWTDDHYEASWSHIFGAKVSNEARFGYVSEVNFTYPAVPAVDSIGLKGVTLSQFPNISITGLTDLGTSAYYYDLDGHYVFNDAVVVVLGRHTLSLGGEYMDYIYSRYNPGVLSGNYDFNGQFTSTSGQSVLGLPDLELGLPHTTTISTNNTWFREIAKYSSLYAQDDYRITPKLTLNLGLRWEFDGPYAEVKNQMYTFNPSLTDTATGKMGAIQFAGYNGAPHNLTGSYYKGFLPRVGFSYHIMRNTVVRGGYGFFELPGIGFGGNAFTSKTTVSTTFESPDGITPAYQLQNGVPPYSPEVGPNGEPLIPTSLTNPTSNVVELQATGSLAYLQQWEFGVQQDLGHGWLAEVDYQGNHGVHLPVTLQTNQIAPTSGCCYGLKNAQSLRPYPQVLNVSYYVNGGASAYSALQAQLTHRWNRGLSMLLAYTYARQLDDVDPSARGDAVGNQNVYDLRAQWGTAMTDIPQRLSATGVYDLPFGAGGSFKTGNRIVDQAIGHWRVSTVASFQVGYPYNISQANTTGLFSASQYVTKVGDPNISRSSRSVTKWFNTAAFQITPSDTLGNAPRAALFGPGQNVWNIGLMRDIPLWEHATFTLRGDAYNAFNHPQFDGLGTSITSGNFGQVTGAHDSRELLVSGRIRF